MSLAAVRRVGGRVRLELMTKPPLRESTSATAFEFQIHQPPLTFNSAVGAPVPQIVSLDGEQFVRAQVGEVECGSSTGFTSQRQIQNVFLSAAFATSFRQNDSVSLGCLHVINNNCSSGSIRNIYKSTPVTSVVDGEVL